ncbi:MAG: hypothetical protein QG602_2763 [Verrucomicrobiota bacterium]|nr:hypothetical protein [Verrucomicrobiota bacterium]
MKLFWKLGLVSGLLLGGCPAALVLSGNMAVKPLDGPYELRLTLDRDSVHPAEEVSATIEFKNTGKRVLWIPRQREIFFGFETANTTSESWSSSCDGLQYVRVNPGKTIRYEKAFVAPDMEGAVKVFVTANRKVFALLTVTRLSPEQVSGLAPGLNPPAARP